MLFSHTCLVFVLVMNSSGYMVSQTACPHAAQTALAVKVRLQQNHIECNVSIGSVYQEVYISDFIRCVVLIIALGQPFL